MLCYNSCKTIEFRFLRPTYNFHKIMLWMYIFNAVLQYSENVTRNLSTNDYRYMVRKIRVMHPGLFKIIESVYPKQIASKIINDINLLKYIVINQESNKDYIGKETDIEDKMLRPNAII